MDYIIEMNNICKQFGTLKANDDVTIQVKKGEIHALLGENGAGKSTLMSVLFGLYQPDSGEILIKGEKVLINNPNDANKLGIGMVHQHFKLVEAFTALENIVLGAEDTKYGFLTLDKAREKVLELSKLYKLEVKPDELISDISVGMQQRVEILKMLYRDAEILIFDEPTAVLTPQEIEELMNIIRKFAKEGKSIILITHKLNEIKAVADRCTVLRKGKYIGTVEVSKTSTEKMAEMMVGRKVSFTVDKKPKTPGDVILKVENLTVLNKAKNKELVKHATFEVRAGEIVGLAGIEGNGQTELVHAITGLRPFSEGSIAISGVDVTKDTVRDKYEKGLGHIPEDRQKHGLILDYNLAENLILQSYYLPEFQKHGFLKFDNIYIHAQNLIERFDIRSASGAKSSARSMSGGNQQKAIIAREISRDPKLLIAVQPTRGLDVGAIEYIHKQIIRQRDEDKGVFMVSLELDEIMDVSDRILVMYEGEIVAELDPKQTTINELGLYMSGSKGGKHNEQQ
ncbi:MAG TPA: ABC transporter ATP-binding protein [Bacilli bacterium]|nr:ABC transporter ATP-binding protein [Bacilli bacterium]